MNAFSPASWQAPWQAPRTATPALSFPYRRTGWGSVIALAAFLPVWLPERLQVGNFSFAFAVPLALALWAMTQPAAPGSLGRALRGAAGQGRGLWLEMFCAGAIAILAAVTMLYSPEPVNAFRVILPMTYGFCTLILFSRISPLARSRLAFAPLFSGCLALGFGLLLERTGSGLGVMRAYRFLGFFENPNQLGIMLVGVWPLAIALLLRARTVQARLTSAIPVLILAASILMSGTKTALALSFVSGTLMWLYHSSRSGTLAATLVRLTITLSAVALAVPGILWVLSWASPAFFARVDSILTNGVWAFPSMQARGAIWQTSLQIGLANPLFGVGAGTSVYGYAHSHNMLLDYFRGMGVLALGAAIVLILSAVSRGANFLLSTWHKREVDRASDTIVAGMYVGAIFHLLANQLSDSFSPTTAFLFWMMYLGAFFTARAGTSFARPAAAAVRRPSTLGWAPRAQPRGPAPGAAI